MKVKETVRNHKLVLACEISPLTNDELCLLCDIHRSTLYNIIRYVHKPRKDLVLKLCRLLKSQPGELGLTYDP